MSLRLAKLPDRTPVRLTLALEPDIHAALLAYAQIYRETYGPEERPEVLAAAMLETFLMTDSGFRRARRAQLSRAVPAGARR